MIPLNYSINYASELAQSPRIVHRQLSSRCMSVISLPIEFLAIAENAIKFPFQTAACALKLPVTLLSLVAQSKTLKECADALTSLKDLVQTALKVIGYATGFFLTATIGLISPYQNFKLHCALSLTTDLAAEKERQIQEEKRRQEIAAYEAVLAAYLHQVILAIQKQSQLDSDQNKPAKEDLTNGQPVQESSSLKEIQASVSTDSKPIQNHSIYQNTNSAPPSNDTVEEQLTKDNEKELQETDQKIDNEKESQKISETAQEIPQTDIPAVPQEISKETEETATESLAETPLTETSVEKSETSVEKSPDTMNLNQAVTMEG